MSSVAPYFSRLRALLAQPGIPSQTEIAQALGTDQPFVSRAMAGDLVRITPRVRRLRRYAAMRIRAYRIGAPIEAPAATEVARSPTVRVAAIRACRDYLKAGFDPRVLREQVDLLRRAQAAPRSR